MVVPCVAIGGITIDNCRPLIEAGADFLAVASGVWDHPAALTRRSRRSTRCFDRLRVPC
jgi:thiamine-phosphate pyrophosphorylase